MSESASFADAQLAWQALDSAGLAYICSDWLDRTRCPVIMHWLAESPKTRHLVVKQLRADFQLEGLPEGANVEYPLTVLQQGPMFVQNIALYIGFVGFSQVVRRSIDGRFKRSFWDVVGEPGYLFISKRAAFYNPGLVARFVPTLQTGYSLTKTEILVAGLSVLRSVLGETGPSAVRRLNLMFPVSVLESLRQQSEVTLDSKELSILNRVVFKLYSEFGGGGS
jgi:hypothetical protein